MARRLVTRGVAVLLRGKKGVGTSGGDWKRETFEDRAANTGRAGAAHEIKAFPAANQQFWKSVRGTPSEYASLGEGRSAQAASVPSLEPMPPGAIPTMIHEGIGRHSKSELGSVGYYGENRGFA